MPIPHSLAEINKQTKPNCKEGEFIFCGNRQPLQPGSKYREPVSYSQKNTPSIFVFDVPGIVLI